MQGCCLCLKNHCLNFFLCSKGRILEMPKWKEKLHKKYFSQSYWLAISLSMEVLPITEVILKDCVNHVCIKMQRAFDRMGTTCVLSCCPWGWFSWQALIYCLWRIFPNPSAEAGIAQSEIVHNNKCSLVSHCGEVDTHLALLLCAYIVGDC